MKHFSVIFIEFITSIILLSNHVCISNDVFQLEYQSTRDIADDHIPVNGRGILKVIEFNEFQEIPMDISNYIHVDYNSKMVIDGTEAMNAWNMNTSTTDEDSYNIFTVFRTNTIDGRYFLGNAYSSLTVDNSKLIVTKPSTADNFQFLCRRISDGVPTLAKQFYKYLPEPQNCMWSAVINSGKEITGFTPLRAFALMHKKEGSLVEVLDVSKNLRKGDEYILVGNTFGNYKRIFKSNPDPLYVPWIIRYSNAHSIPKKLYFHLSKHLWKINFVYHWNHYKDNDYDDQRRGIWLSSKISAKRCTDNEECLYKITNANKWEYWKNSKEMKYSAEPNSMMLCSKKNGEYFIKKFVSYEKAQKDCCLWDKSLTNEGKYHRISTCDE